jgi:hypothetical protein
MFTVCALAVPMDCVALNGLLALRGGVTGTGTVA